jgi:hypothetical protein
MVLCRAAAAGDNRCAGASIATRSGSSDQSCSEWNLVHGVALRRACGLAIISIERPRIVLDNRINYGAAEGISNVACRESQEREIHDLAVFAGDRF